MTPDELVRRLQVRFGVRLHWVDGLGGSRKVILGDRSTVIGNFGALTRMPRQLILRHLDNLGLTWADVED